MDSSFWFALVISSIYNVAGFTLSSILWALLALIIAVRSVYQGRKRMESLKRMEDELEKQKKELDESLDRLVASMSKLEENTPSNPQAR